LNTSNREPVAVVTGARRGIGAAIALGLAEQGFDVMINAVHGGDKVRQQLDKIEDIGRKSVFCQADISRNEGRLKIVESLKESFRRVDVLVNNAGVAPSVRTDLLEATEESFDRVISINLKGPYFLTQLIAKWMIELRKENIIQNPKIINISSNSAYTSSPSRGEYCISKAGVSMMTKLYADRLSEQGINVYEIRPGIIKTDMTANVVEKYDRLITQGITPIKRWGTPEDVAKAVIAIAKDNFPFSTGEVINVDGGFHLHRL
jgi:NAD(P)-dependent dehydrogenase (short-subunit alcohol dehydrogenase family)